MGGQAGRDRIRGSPRGELYCLGCLNPFETVHATDPGHRSLSSAKLRSLGDIPGCSLDMWLRSPLTCRKLPSPHTGQTWGPGGMFLGPPCRCLGGPMGIPRLREAIK